MSLPTKIIFILIPVVVIALLAFLKFRPGAEETTGDPGADPANTATAVKAVEVRLRPFETQLVFNGSLLPQDRIEVRSELSGRLTALHVHSGRDVEAGEVLAEIDTRELEADLRALTNQLKLARENARRFEALFSTEGVTESDLDEAVSRREVLRAQVESLEVLRDKGRILAPFSGTLGLRRVSEGELLDSSSLITTLQDIDHLYLDFIIPERFMPNIHLGDTVGFRVSGQDRKFNATIQAVDPQVDFETRSITVRATVDNTDRALMPGSYARVELPITSEASIVVPAEAVVRSLGSVFVFRVDGELAVRQEVEIGRRSPSEVEILEGLSPGDLVVTAGVQALRDGAMVEIIGMETR